MNPMFQQQETGGRLMGRMWGTFVPGVLGELGQVALMNSAIFCFFWSHQGAVLNQLLFAEDLPEANQSSEVPN